MSHRALANGLCQVGVSVLQFPFKPRDMRPQACADRRRGAQEAILFGRQHLEQLSSSGQQHGQGSGLRIRKRARVEAHDLGELREHLGIECIDLGQVPTGLGEVAHLTGLTKTTGNPAVASALVSGSSIPPVASNTIRVGLRVRSCSTNAAMADSSCVIENDAPGRMAISKRACEISMPTKSRELIAASCRAQPCEMRAQRPSQLFGLYRWEGLTTHADTRSGKDHGTDGLSGPNAS